MSHAIGSKSERSFIGNVCYYALDLVVILTIIAVLLAVVHKYATQNINVAQTLPGASVVFYNDDPFLEVGDVLPVYRFSADWKVEIGKVRVARRDGNKFVSNFDEKHFSWPMGRQGQVTAQLPDWVQVNIGSALGLRAGDQLVLFDDRHQVGRIELKEISTQSAWGTLLSSSQGDLRGLTASEFSVPTQIAYFKNPYVFIGELAIIALAVCWWLFKLLTRRRSLAVTIKHQVSKHLRLDSKTVIWITSIGLLVPFVWLTANFVVEMFDYFVVEQLLEIPVVEGLFSGKPIVGLVDIRILYAVVAFWFLFYLITRQRSPVLAFWNQFRYRPRGYPELGWLNRRLIIWCLHLVIAYAFASTLHSFLIGNMNALARLGWPEANLSFANLNGAFHGLVHVLTHRPQVASIEEGFEIARYALWSITIVGCLIGYGHSIVGVLWGKHIRNLDFTLMGWVTNAACYPLLGVVIWQMMPPLAGSDPVITQGPLYYLMLVTELMLNILYTSSIWNLGKRFGVMTDKGVCSSGWYSVIRHPNYTLESLMFVMLELRGATGLPQGAAIGMYVLLYYLRSEREDHFMTNSNPDYVSYKEKTPYKFIPGIY